MGVVDAVGDGLGGEPAEDDGVDGADPCAGEQGDGQLGGHAHVDGDAIAFLYAEGFEGAGGALDFDVELGVGEGPDFGLTGLGEGFGFPEDGDLVGVFAEGVAVDAVIAEVELAVDEPFGPGQVPLEDFGPGLEPMEFSGGGGPEGFRICDGAGVEVFVGGERGDVGVGREIRGRREDAGFVQCGFEVLIDGNRGCFGGHRGSLLGKTKLEVASNHRTSSAGWASGGGVLTEQEVPSGYWEEAGPFAADAGPAAAAAGPRSIL